MLRVGVFWVCGFPTHLRAEDIGRHMIRLVDGLLGHDKQLDIVLVTDPINFYEAIIAFSHVGPSYGNRLNIISVDDVGQFNKTLSVDMWIVPYVGLWQATQLDKPFILCLHDLVYIHFPEKALDNCSLIIDGIAKQVAQKAAIVVCNSNFVRENEGLRYLGLPQNKVKVVTIAVPIEEYQTFNIIDETSFRQKYGFTSPYFVYPSAIRYYKNHHRLIEAFINFKNSYDGHDFNLLLIMTDNLSPSPEQLEFHNVAYKYAGQKACQSIIFHGCFSEQEMPSLYYHAAGTLVPTLFEGSCPFPILESLTMGAPVAFSDIPVVWETLPKTEDVISFDPAQ